MAATSPPTAAPLPPAELATRLCLACALCCNGVLFKDVELQPGDDPPRLAALGLPLRQGRAKCRFPQPCPALSDCRCGVYAERPRHCRDFECALFKAVADGQRDLPSARRTIRLARERAERVRGLLRSLGDADEDRALSLRFRRTRARVEAGPLDEETADRFGQLTLAVHDLNLLLREAFYP